MAPEDYSLTGQSQLSKTNFFPKTSKTWWGVWGAGNRERAVSRVMPLGYSPMDVMKPKK